MSKFWRRLVLGASLAGLSACQATAPLALAGEEATGVVVVGSHRSGVAPAILSLPATIELLSIDGDKHPLLLRQRAIQLALTPGKHQLEVRYFNLWDLDVDDHEIVKSEPVTLSVTLKSGRRYAFAAPPSFDKPAQAQRYVADFAPQVISHKPTVMVAVPPTASNEERAAAQRAAATEVVSTPVSEASLDRLKNLWHELSPEEQQAFRRWMGDANQ